MSIWLSVIGACVLTVVAVARFSDRNRPKERDPDWGDWPSDHMAP